MNKVLRHSFLACFALILTSGRGRADWLIVPNPVTSNPEAVWSDTPEEQSAANVLYSYLNGSSWAAPTTLSSIGQEGSGPMLAFEGTGARHVAWGTEEAPPRILLRSLPSSGGTWSSVIEVSISTEASEGPSIIYHDDLTFVSYQVGAAAGHSVKVSKIDADSNVERSLVRSTSSTSPLRTVLHAEGGYLWLDWIDSSSDLGFSEWNGSDWGTVQYESYAGETDIKLGRDRIQDRILAGHP